MMIGYILYIHIHPQFMGSGTRGFPPKSSMPGAPAVAAPHGPHGRRVADLALRRCSEGRLQGEGEMEEAEGTGMDE